MNITEPTLATLVGTAGLTVLAVEVPGTARRRLAEMGVREGARVAALRRTAGGGVLVGLGHDRLALDADTARRIRVAAPAAVVR